MKTSCTYGDADRTDHQTVSDYWIFIMWYYEWPSYTKPFRNFHSVHVFLRSSKPPRVEHTTRHERLRGSYQQHTFTSLLICTQWVPVTWQHKHERERIWKCNRTEQRFPDLNEQYKVSLCSISHVQGYSGPAWTHTVLVLSASKLIQP